MLLATRAGVDPAKVLEVVQASGFRSPYFEFKGQALLRRDFETHFAIDLMHKDLGLFLDNAAAHRVPTPATAAVRQVLRARARGGKRRAGHRRRHHRLRAARRHRDSPGFLRARPPPGLGLYSPWARGSDQFIWKLSRSPQEAPRQGEKAKRARRLNRVNARV